MADNFVAPLLHSKVFCLGKTTCLSKLICSARVWFLCYLFINFFFLSSVFNCFIQKWKRGSLSLSLSLHPIWVSVVGFFILAVSKGWFNGSACSSKWPICHRVSISFSVAIITAELNGNWNDGCGTETTDSSVSSFEAPFHLMFEIIRSSVTRSSG